MAKIRMYHFVLAMLLLLLNTAIMYQGYAPLDGELSADFRAPLGLKQDPDTLETWGGENEPWKKQKLETEGSPAVNGRAGKEGGAQRGGEPKLLGEKTIEDQKQPGTHPVSIEDQLEAKYLFPHLIYGPSNQYHGLKEAIIIAMALNRTLVLPRILVHYQQLSKDHRSILRFEEVFDLARIRELLPVINNEEYLQLTNHTVSVLWRVVGDASRVKYEKHFLRIYELEVKEVLELRQDLLSLDSVERIHEAFSNRPEKGAALASTFGLAMDFSGVLSKNPWLEQARLVSEHLRFSSFYQILTSRMNLFESKPYLAIHLRTNEKEEECPKYAKRAGKMCLGLGRPYYFLDVPCLAQTALELLVAQDLGGVYLAVAEDPRNLIEQMRALLSPRFPVLALPDIIEEANEQSQLLKGSGGRRKELLLSPFERSTFEQQLCQNSHHFMGTRESTWSQFVLYQRLSANPGEERWSYLDDCKCVDIFTKKMKNAYQSRVVS